MSGQQGQTMEASRPILSILVPQFALWDENFGFILGKTDAELDTCGRMVVYSQQPTTLLGILLSWCISTVVAS